MKARREEVETARNSKAVQQRQAMQPASTRSPEESWALIMNNIALKEGDYPGSKNVARMRQAIVNQYNHCKKAKGPHPELI